MKDLYLITRNNHVLSNCIYLTTLFPTKVNLLLAGLGFMQAADTAIPRHSNRLYQVTDYMNNVRLHIGSKKDHFKMMSVIRRKSSNSQDDWKK